MSGGVLEKYVEASGSSAAITTAGLGVSRRADASSEEHQAYLPSSVAQTYRIGPERDSQAGCGQMGLFQRHKNKNSRGRANGSIRLISRKGKLLQSFGDLPPLLPSPLIKHQSP